ncbi:MAG: hypothetical protein U0524_01940 [Candidatus Saccharimonadales bacterium]
MPGIKPSPRLISAVIASVLLTTVLVGAAPIKTHAVESPKQGFNIITSPLPVKLSAKPGQTVQTELRMKNRGTEPELIKVGLMKFGATGENGQPNLFDLTPRDNYSSWVSFSPSQFVAEPNVWKTVTMTINVPDDAELGYYMAVTFSRANQTADKKSTNYKGAVATLVLLDAGGNANRDMELLSFTATKKLYEYLPATFDIKLRNKGNIYISPTGNIFIEKGGKVVDTLNVNEAGGSVLPNSNRVFQVKWKNGFPVFEDKIVDGKPVPGKNGLVQQLKWDIKNISEFRFGKYTAKLLVVYDNGTQDVPLESQLTFWVIPWKILLVVLIIVGLLGYGLFTFLRSALRKTKGGVGKIRGAKK